MNEAIEPGIHIVQDVLDLNSRGWLPILIKDFGKASLCYGTKIEVGGNFLKTKEFVVLEGIHKNRRAKLLNTNDWPRVKKYLKNKIGPRLQLSLGSSQLLFPGLGEYNVYIKKGTLTKGECYILLPSYQHTQKNKKEYLDEKNGGSRFSETWFEFQSEQHNNQQYLHFGKYSEGCITLPFRPKGGNGYVWSKIFFHLLKARIQGEYLASMVINE